jgi:hypothetical protein
VENANSFATSALVQVEELNMYINPSHDDIDRDLLFKEKSRGNTNECGTQAEQRQEEQVPYRLA